MSKRLWRLTRKQLQEAGVWRDSDAALLERYVRALERARVARGELWDEDLERMVLTTVGSQGQLVQHPNVKTAREAERDAHEYAKALLLSPDARQKAAGQPEPVRGGAFADAF